MSAALTTKCHNSMMRALDGPIFSASHCLLRHSPYPVHGHLHVGLRALAVCTAQQTARRPTTLLHHMLALQPVQLCDVELISERQASVGTSACLQAVMF